MGGVEDDRGVGLAHDRQRAHVRHQIVVAKTGATFTGHETVFRQAGLTRRCARLADHVLHVVRRQELALLDVDRPAGLRHGTDEVGLAAQESRRLQDVHDGGHLCNLVLGVNVGQQRQPEFAFDLGQDLKPGLNAGAAKGAVAGAIGLVKAALENERDAQLGGDFLQHAGSVHLQLLGLNDAGSGDQKEGLAQTDLKTTQLHQATALTSLGAAWWSSAALMKELKSGCPFQGVDLNSG